MPEEKTENLQTPDGESNLPSSPAFTQSLTDALKKGELETVDLSRNEKGGIPPKPEAMPHGRGRLMVAGVALIISLVGPCLPFVPENVRTGLLAIAGSISTSLFKGFERY